MKKMWFGSFHSDQTRDRGQPGECAGVAPADRSREARELGRADLVVAASLAAGRPPGSVGGQRDHDPEAHRRRALHQVVVRPEARIGGGVGGIEARLGSRIRLRSDLVPLHLDSQRVGAQRLDLVQRVLANRRSRAHQVGVILEEGPLARACRSGGRSQREQRDQRQCGQHGCGRDAASVVRDGVCKAQIPLRVVSRHAHHDQNPCPGSGLRCARVISVPRRKACVRCRRQASWFRLHRPVPWRCRAGWERDSPRHTQVSP